MTLTSCHRAIGGSSCNCVSSRCGRTDSPGSVLATITGRAECERSSRGIRGVTWGIRGTAPGRQIWVLNLQPALDGIWSVMSCEIAGPPDGAATPPPKQPADARRGPARWRRGSACEGGNAFQPRHGREEDPRLLRVARLLQPLAARPSSAPSPLWRSARAQRELGSSSTDLVTPDHDRPKRPRPRITGRTGARWGSESEGGRTPGPRHGGEQEPARAAA